MEFKKLAEINVTQRTALGDDQGAESKIYLVTFDNPQDGQMALVQFEDSLVGLGNVGARVVGYVNIIRPRILWGSHNELLRDFVGMAKRRLETDGIVQRNDYWFYFVSNDLCKEGVAI